MRLGCRGIRHLRSPTLCPDVSLRGKVGCPRRRTEQEQPQRLEGVGRGLFADEPAEHAGQLDGDSQTLGPRQLLLLHLAMAVTVPVVVTAPVVMPATTPAGAFSGIQQHQSSHSRGQSQLQLARCQERLGGALGGLHELQQEAQLCVWARRRRAAGRRPSSRGHEGGRDEGPNPLQQHRMRPGGRHQQPLRAAAREARLALVRVVGERLEEGVDVAREPRRRQSCRHIAQRDRQGAPEHRGELVRARRRRPAYLVTSRLEDLCQVLSCHNRAIALQAIAQGFQCVVDRLVVVSDRDVL
mmetsp:Transcript_134758/g.430601  ORF Transcript_134758/g.430601 Transcript_134758/m.430601 type:complete len:298 (-) Transcript_134758:902-1795(-)